MHMYTPNVYIHVHVYYNICTVYPRALHNIEFWQPVLLFEKLSKMLGNEQTARPGVWYQHILRVWIKPSKTRGLLNCCMEKYGKYANTNPLFKEPAQSSVSSPHLLSPFFFGSFGTYMPYHGIARSPSIPSPNGTDTTWSCRSRTWQTIRRKKES